MLWLSSSKEVDVETVDETMDSPPQSVHYEELVEVNSCAVAKLNLNRPAKEQAELSKSKLDEFFLWSKLLPPCRGLPFFPDFHTEVSSVPRFSSIPMMWD